MKTEEKIIKNVFGNRYKLSQPRAAEYMALCDQESARTEDQEILDMTKKSRFYFDARFGAGWDK